MAPPKRAGPSLSVDFLQHLGVQTNDGRGQSRRNGIQNRREQRKEDRTKFRQPSNWATQNQPMKARGPPRSQPHASRQKDGSKAKANSKPKQVRLVNPELEDDSTKEDGFDDSGVSDGEDADFGGGSGASGASDKSGTDKSDNGAPNNGAATSNKMSSRMRKRLDQDDAEIAELERKLGMKGRKNLPQAFKADGLDDLLGAVDGGNGIDAEPPEEKKRKAEAADWLRSKRQKAMGLRDDSGVDEDEPGGNSGDSESEGRFDDSGDDFGSFEDSDQGSDDEDEKLAAAQQSFPKRQRENPYIAPVSETTVAMATSESTPPQKYMPPALRRAQQGADLESEATARIRRQAHSLIARLSDANMLTILGEVEKLYLDHPRQYVTESVTDKLLEQVQVETALTNNVTVLIAGFATMVYMVKGTDFGAHFIQQNATVFKQQYDTLAQAEAAAGASRDMQRSWAPSSKVALNLFGLMAELYNFRMIGPNLIYDYIRTLLSSLTETNTELLLRVFETSGHRLRQDDPRAFKEIVALIRPAIVRVGGEKSLSVRTRHMIDRIGDLKKNDKKKQRDAGSSGFGHAERIRKLLGNLPTSRKLEAAGPLRVSLADIEQADKRGKWWLVGASWVGRDDQLMRFSADKKGEDDVREAGSSGSKGSTKAAAKSKVGDSDGGEDDVLGAWGDDIADIEELDLLAREQGMNTDARRSIFVTLLSAADSKDAYARLLRLGLNKYEKREIANVLLRCVGSEQHYNRYYALVARQVCNGDRRMQWTFQASLWKLFRRVGEPMFGDVPDDDEVDDTDEATDLRRLVNASKLYGYLVACGCLGLDILKCLSLVRLQAKTRMFVEVLLVTFFTEARKAGSSGCDGVVSSSSSNSNALIRKRFQAAASNGDLRRGLQYFIDKVVRKSTLVEKRDAGAVARACDKAQRVLEAARD